MTDCRVLVQGDKMMLDPKRLLEELQIRIDEITATISDPSKPVMEPLVQVLQSTRARALMDVVDAINACVTIDNEE